ncbi:MAG: transketolase C-terminal domain-containing protein [Actinomycetota bacterium]
MSGAAATREAFGEAIVRVGGDERIVVLDGDLRNSNYSEKFEAAYPGRFVEVGIAEHNMLGIASGLALSGKQPWACSFAAFVAGRLEVIRVSIAYNEANVRIVGTHVGIGIGDDGATQMSLEDIAAMRALPNMAVIQPCDATETHAAVDYLANTHEGPAFLRLTRQKLEPVHENGDYLFEFGKAQTLRDGKDIAIVATGALVQESLKAAEALASDGISASVINVHTLQPFDADAVVAAARQTEHVLSAEDHNVNGGLGSAVAEAIAEAGVGAKLSRVAVRSFGESGSQEELYEKYGLSASRVADAARALVRSDTPV